MNMIYKWWIKISLGSTDNGWDIGINSSKKYYETDGFSNPHINKDIFYAYSCHGIKLSQKYDVRGKKYGEK